MKKTYLIIFGTLLFSGSAFLFSSCVGGGGYYGGGGYHDGGPWYRDGPWMDGGPRLGVGVDIHPPGWGRR
jgi:hypothetical protein